MLQLHVTVWRCEHGVIKIDMRIICVSNSDAIHMCDRSHLLNKMSDGQMVGRTVELRGYVPYNVMRIVAP